MPNRILRDWTDSKKIDKLSVAAECFFVRLMMKADDYGCFTADTRLLYVNLFPFKRDLQESDIALWLQECADAQLIELYEHEQEPYLCINKFGQVLRIKKRKYPPPPSAMETKADAKQVRSRNTTPANKKQTNAQQVQPKEKLFENADFTELIRWMQDYAPVLLQLPSPLTEDQYTRLREKYTEEQIRELLEAMGNNRNIGKKQSVFATFNQWAVTQRWQSIDNHSSFQPSYHENRTETAESKLSERVQRAVKRGQGASA